MTVPEFAQDDRVRGAVAATKEITRTRPLSDIVDARGNQYVDLVMEGGGIHGIALLGYTHVLEQAGVRFLDIAGTSAGAIFALALAAADTKDKAKSETVAKELARLDLRSLLDGDDDAQRFTDAMSLEPGFGKYVRLATSGVQVLDDVYRQLGVHPGRQFEQEMAAILSGWNIRTTDDLLLRMACPRDGLELRGGGVPESRQRASRLALIAAEITTETKVELPRMAPLFWKDHGAMSPAVYARASMSIPFVFQPLIAEDMPSGDGIRELWKELASWDDQRDIPSRAVFVDGGIVSNFPIGVFHVQDAMPKAPTFGVKLGSEKRAFHEVNGPWDLARAVFDSARHALDYDFLTQHPDYCHLVTYIDTDGHDWLDFGLSMDAKVELFARGAQAAQRFLAEFDWHDYQEVRRKLGGPNLAVSSQE